MDEFPWHEMWCAARVLLEISLSVSKRSAIMVVPVLPMPTVRGHRTEVCVEMAKRVVQT